MTFRRWQLTVALPCALLGMAVFYFAYLAEGTLQVVAQVVGVAYIAGLILAKRWLDRRYASPS